MNNFVFAVITLDRALIWKHSLESGTFPEFVEASDDNPQYLKQHNSFSGHRDRSTINPSFAQKLSVEFMDAEHIYLVGAGSGKANSVNQFVDFLKAKHPNIAEKVLGTAIVDVNSLSNNQLLEIGRERKTKFLHMV